MKIIFTFFLLVLFNNSYTQKISAGYGGSLYLCDFGMVKSWGGSGDALAQGIPNCYTTLPGNVINLDSISDVQIAEGHSIYLTTEGMIWVSGNNADGQLGNGNYSNTFTPELLGGIDNIVKISSSWLHNLILTNTGQVLAWGNNTGGQIGDGMQIPLNDPQVNLPYLIDTLENIVAISAGGYHSMALDSDGHVWTWGWNGSGQLGIGNTISKTTPVKLQDIDSVISISAGANYSMALRADGNVWVWGRAVSF